MKRKEYSAGMVKHSFWFQEFRQVMHLLAGGKTMAEIKLMSQEENIFMASSKDRATMIFNTVAGRIKSLPQGFYALFEESDLSSQKVIALLGVMASDTLFFDFMYEIFREKLIIGVDNMSLSDMAIFFKNKQLQSPKVAGWKDNTLKRLAGSYKTILLEAGLLERSSQKILKPILDRTLEDCLKENNLTVMLGILRGER
ncbi:MAG: hypothetical protein PWP30_857 [Eubacteriaceae bacterium]|nr:hypothetical protein [Eubacteriaceae bacterium]MDK2961778.1 hypothetical protein [Eubacteriaceae bacterium]